MQKLLFSYLKFWSSGYLKRTNPEIVAVTGSVGKTCAKEAIFEVLKVKYADNVRKSSGNLNNESGLPLSVLNYASSPVNVFQWLQVLISAPFRSFLLKSAKILVLEYAADKPGDIKYLTSFARPKVAVLTAIGPAHMSAYGSIDKIIEEKTDLLRALPSDGWAVLNLDDENVKKVSYGGRWQKKTYAIVNEAGVFAKNIKTEIKNNEARTTFEVNIDNQKAVVDQCTLGLKTNVLASLAGATVGNIYGLSISEITEGLGNVIPEKHRLNVVKGKNDITIIDDSYNANPQSMKAALELLEKLPKGNGRKIAIIGDMLEIGDITDSAHKEIGELALKIADLVVSIGEHAKKYNAQKYFKSTSSAGKYILNEARPGDIILLKGSRKIALDKLVNLLKD